MALLELASTPAAPGLVADAGDHAPPLRIAWVKVGGLWPLNTGGRLRSFNIIRELSYRHQLTVITTYSPGEDAAALAVQLPRVRRVTALPYTPAKRGSARFILALMQSWLTSLPVDLHKNHISELERQVKALLSSGEFDLCVADFLFAVPNIPPTTVTPLLFFAHNVEYQIWRRLCHRERRLLRRALLAIEWRKMRAYERRACRRAGLCVAVSEDDRRLLGRDSPGCRIRDIPTGVDLDYFHAAADVDENPLEVVFTGSMDWHPNEDAVRYFIDSILPLIREKIPQLAVTIVGRNPSAGLLEAAAAAGIRLSGTVDDVRPFIDRAAVFIVPLRVGGGTRLKIYEALAMAKAVVSTRVGAEGLPLTDGDHLLIADEPRRFADAVLSLLDDPARRRQLGTSGRKLMEEQYSWQRVARHFENHCRELLQ